MAPKSLLTLAAAAAVAAAAHAPGTPNAARAAAGADAVRARRIDELPLEALYPRDAHARTRAAHRRIMSAWRAPALGAGSPVISPVTYGADPTGRTDSTAAFQAAMAAVLASNTSGHHMSDGIVDLGGVVLDLGGGDYLLSSPLVVPPMYGNLRIIDGTLRASTSFDPARYVIEIGTAKCNTPSGQGSCNENVGMSGLTVDGSHVATGCILIQSTMGSTLDASSAIFGFNVAGVTLQGGHEAMISETWVAAYFWSDPKKERNDAVGILINGNDHYVSNTIVFSARVGVQLNGAANILNGVHTWNCATGNGGIGILNAMSQNRFDGCYLDFTDLKLTNAQQVTVMDGFFLGGAQVVFAAPKAGSSVQAVTLSGNVWYDTGSAALAVNETLGTWTSVTDLEIYGSTQPGAPKGVVAATKVYAFPAGGPNVVTVDFSDVLLFPHVPIQAASVALSGGAAVNAVPSAMTNVVPDAGSPLAVTVTVTGGNGWAGSLVATVTADQSAHSGTFKVAPNGVA